MRPRDSFFEFTEVYNLFWANDLAKYFDMKPSRKINVGFATDSRKFFLFVKSGRLQIKEFRSTAIYLSIYMYK